MIKDVSSALSSIRPAGPTTDSHRPGQTQGPSVEGFREHLQKVNDAAKSNAASGSQAIQSAALKFSNHAVDRMQSRGIRFSPEEMGKIESAVGKAAAKGSKEALLLTDAAALIVSVKDKTVVTVMDKTSLKDNVFTNIDSAVMI